MKPNSRHSGTPPICASFDIKCQYFATNISTTKLQDGLHKNVFGFEAFEKSHDTVQDGHLQVIKVQQTGTNTL